MGNARGHSMRPLEGREGGHHIEQDCDSYCRESSQNVRGVVALGQPEQYDFIRRSTERVLRIVPRTRRCAATAPTASP